MAPPEPRKVPKLYRAIAEFNSGEADDLVLKPGDVVAVTDEGEGPESWW